MLTLKKIARQNVVQQQFDLNDFLIYLRGWWSKKYNRPKNDPLLLQMYNEDLVIEYFEDIFSTNKEELAKFEKEIGIGNYLDYEEWVKKQDELEKERLAKAISEKNDSDFEDTY